MNVITKFGRSFVFEIYPGRGQLGQACRGSNPHTWAKFEMGYNMAAPSTSAAPFP